MAEARRVVRLSPDVSAWMKEWLTNLCAACAAGIVPEDDYRRIRRWTSRLKKSLEADFEHFGVQREDLSSSRRGLSARSRRDLVTSQLQIIVVAVLDAKSDTVTITNLTTRSL